jgi:septal ring-binding cell division protein DamX
MRTAFERDGDIRSVDLAAAFATLWRERPTGALAFSRADRRVRFEILKGTLVGVFSSDPSFDTAEVLVRAGKLDPSALEGRRPTAGRDRARAAREQGLLTERDWRWGEKIRAVEIFADLLTWLEGRYSFDREEKPEAGELKIGIERLIVELFLRSRDREFIHHALGATDAPLQRSDEFDDVFPGLGLTPDALAVVAAIDGRATAAEICRRVPPDPFSVQKLLAALATLGLVHPEYAAQPKSRAAAVPPPPDEQPSAPPIPPEPPSPTVRPRRERVRAAPRREPEPPLPQEPAPPEIAPETAVPAPPEEPAIVELTHDEAPIELPIGPAADPGEPEPAILAWDQGPPEPLDQPLDLPEPPELLRSSRPGLTPVWLLGALAVAVAALLFLRTRPARNLPPTGAPETAVSTPVPTPLPTASPTGEAVRSAPLAISGPDRMPSSPTAISATRIPPNMTAPPPTAVSTRVPSSLSPPPPAAAAARPAAPADRRRWLERAARDRAALAGDRRAVYTIQLELVCELASLEEALRYDRGQAMRILVSDHRGRECFRVVWGSYSTLGEAIAAKAAAPRFFFTPTNQPVVVSTRALLP